MRKTLIIWLSALIVSSAVYAVTTRYIEISTLDNFLAGKSEWVEISALGKIRPGQAFKKHKLGEQQVWSILPHSSGRYFVGTGLRGKVLMFDGRKISTVLETESVIVSSLVEGRGGKVYASVAPGGEIYVINANGSGGKKFCKLEDKYVWALAAGKDGTIYAGTGPEGIIYAIGRDAKPKKIMELKGDQVVRLAIDSKGKLLAGTAKKGVLYRIDSARGHSSAIVASFPKMEISGLALGPENSVILGLNSLKIRAQKPQLIKRAETQPGAKPEETPQSSGADAAGAQAGPSGALARAKCRIVRVTEDGIIETIFQQNKMFISDVVNLADGRVIFSTGPEGRLFAISSDNEISLLNDLPESQGSALAAGKGELAAVGTASPAVLYLANKGAGKGAEFTSAVLDASLPSEWGRISWKATGGGITVETRGGNVENPDDSWSKWRVVGSSGQPIPSPAGHTACKGRYLQVRIKWSNSSTEVRSVRVYYRPVNQPPHIYFASVDGGEGKSSRKGAPPLQSFSSSRPNRSSSKVIKWKANNPDGDTLGYLLEYRREGEDVWVPITADFIGKTTFKWTTSDISDGTYRIRITATDELSNPPGREKISRWITEPFLVDNRKPSVKNLNARGNVITGTASDESSVIQGIAYSLDGGTWIPIWPEDGFYDQNSEKFRIVLNDLDSGSHEITVSVEDEGGNIGIGAVAFSVK